MIEITRLLFYNVHCIPMSKRTLIRIHIHFKHYYTYSIHVKWIQIPSEKFPPHQLRSVIYGKINKFVGGIVYLVVIFHIIFCKCKFQNYASEIICT